VTPSLNSSGPTISRVVLGCVGLSTLPTKKAAFGLLETAVWSGIAHFDTARIYGQGFSERLLGEFLATHGADLHVTTKLGPPDGRLARLPTSAALALNWLRNRLRAPRPSESSHGRARPEPSHRITQAHVEASVEASLRSLRRSRIDVFLLHECLPSQLDDKARDFIARLRHDGTIGSFGIGTARATIDAFFTGDPLCEVLQYDCPPGSRSNLMQRFPAMTHIHHSIFKHRGSTPHAEVLRQALAANPDGRVIFGTRQPGHLRETIGFHGRH